MIYKEHQVELFVNGQRLDLESQNSLNLRFQNVLYDPEKISSTQAEYSFEFELPSTPNNDKIFDYANNLSKLNKFHNRYKAEVYADGTIIFEGTLTLNGYKGKMYKCNLVSVKVYSFDDIFGDAVLCDIPWEIPFDGAGSKTSGYTIDYYNDEISNLKRNDVCFPFICYGAFQKSPKSQDSAGKEYTSKFDLDKYNRWYVESFYPSLSMLETIRKAFEFKGYTVGGNAFEDVFLKDIFMSVNLADGQSPDYNLGNPKFGAVDIATNWSCPQDTPSPSIWEQGTTYGTVQELKYPYLKSGDKYWDCRTECIEVDPDYNFKNIRVYDMLSSADGGSVSVGHDSYLYQPNEHLIVIPADGFYQITLIASSRLLQTNSITASQLVHNGGMAVEERDITFRPDFKITTPLEIQLVRNYEEDVELIKGKNNFRCYDGYPDNETRTDGSYGTNYFNWTTCFPHEKLGKFTMSPTDYSNFGNNIYESDYSIGYAPYDGDLLCYDPIVNPNFICGFTTMGNKNGGGTAAVIKNGYSWNKQHSERQDIMYLQNGYQVGSYDSSFQQVWSATTHNQNSYPNSPTNTFSQTSDSMNGKINCLVYLKKNDVLSLLAIHRDYSTTSGESVSYKTLATVSLNIKAASPESMAQLISRGFGYNSNPDFSYNLKLSNFLNKETKISDWLHGVVDAYNLEVIQDGKNVFLNVKKQFNRDIPVAVDIDDRVNSAESEAERITYPASMAVRYKIDTDEWGFEKSVTPPEKLNDPDWKDYGDSGFTVIKLNDDEYETSKSDKNLQFSYTWYDNFNWIDVNSSFEENRNNILNLRIPVISKFSYMIDGYDYDESMKHDGYGQPQRFWFRPVGTMAFVWTRTYPPEKIEIFEPSNIWEWPQKNLYCNLSYKTTEPSLLQYFNITPYLASNYVIVDVYLNPEEYKMVKNGSMVHFDSDLYYVVEVNGYDPTGNNPTELKMIKKV